MRLAACDPDSFYPLRRLVEGPFQDLEDLQAVERFIRTVVLHDDIVMELTPWPYDPRVEEFAEAESAVITAVGPVLTGYGFFGDGVAITALPEIELSPALIEIAAQHANAGEGNPYFEAHIDFLKRTLAIVEQGGSALLCGGVGREAISRAQQYPEALFQQIDNDWRQFAEDLHRDGLRLSVPPVLGIVLTQCARRDAIPYVIRDLREEWAAARRKVWELLDAQRRCRTLAEALEISRQLSEASRLFSPAVTAADTRPVRVFWELITGAGIGALAAQVSGGNPVVGLVTGGLAQAARSIPPLLEEFGPALFGRGAFDLARHVRRAALRVEFEALPRLLSETERRTLGL